MVSIHTGAISRIIISSHFYDNEVHAKAVFCNYNRSGNFSVTVNIADSSFKSESTFEGKEGSRLQVLAVTKSVRAVIKITNSSFQANGRTEGDHLLIQVKHKNIVIINVTNCSFMAAKYATGVIVEATKVSNRMNAIFQSSTFSANEDALKMIQVMSCTH